MTSSPSRRGNAGPLSWLAALAAAGGRLAAALLAALLMLGALLVGAAVAGAVLVWALWRGRRQPPLRRAGRPPAPPQAPGEVIDVELREVREPSAAAPPTPRG